MIGALWIPKFGLTTKWQSGKKMWQFCRFAWIYNRICIQNHCISRTLMKISENFLVSPNLSIQSAPITPKIYTKPVLYMIPKSLEQIFEKLFLKKVMGVQK